MKRCTLITTVLLLCFVIVCPTLSACNDNNYSYYPDSESTVNATMLFEENFDTLDETKWNVYTKKTLTDNGYGPESGIRRGGYWDKEQVFTEDGNLIIRTEQKEDGNYYTGAIDSNGKFDHHFGYYEARCYLPEAYGIWAAFWIMCNKMGTPSMDAKVAGTEIDIFESPYYDDETSPDPTKSDNYQSAIHVGDYGTLGKTYTNTTWMPFMRPDKTKDVKIYGDWHVFALDWQEDYYRFYFDGTLMWDTNFKNNVSNVDSFLFLSVEIGGNDGVAGNTPFGLGGGRSITTNEDNVLPQDFKVDYVRVYDVMPA